MLELEFLRQNREAISLGLLVELSVVLSFKEVRTNAGISLNEKQPHSFIIMNIYLVLVASAYI